MRFIILIAFIVVSSSIVLSKPTAPSNDVDIYKDNEHIRRKRLTNEVISKFMPTINALANPLNTTMEMIKNVACLLDHPLGNFACVGICVLGLDKNGGSCESALKCVCT